MGEHMQFQFTCTSLLAQSRLYTRALGKTLCHDATENSCCSELVRQVVKARVLPFGVRYGDECFAYANEDSDGGGDVAMA